MWLKIKQKSVYTLRMINNLSSNLPFTLLDILCATLLPNFYLIILQYSISLVVIYNQRRKCVESEASCSGSTLFSKRIYLGSVNFHRK